MLFDGVDGVYYGVERCQGWCILLCVDGVYCGGSLSC